MRTAIPVAGLALSGLLIWQPTLREIGLAFGVVLLALIAGVGRLGFQSTSMEIDSLKAVTHGVVR